jgi:hypothetical protein
MQYIVDAAFEVTDFLGGHSLDLSQDLHVDADALLPIQTLTVKCVVVHDLQLAHHLNMAMGSVYIL